MIDVITTVKNLGGCGVSIRSLSEGSDPSTRGGRPMLNLMATFAEYEHEIIQERVCVGVNAAKARGVRIGRPAPAPEKAARNFRTVQHLIDSESLGTVEAAKTVGWSKVTYHRPGRIKAQRLRNSHRS